jgi:cytochrome c oxidase subunit 2
VTSARDRSSLRLGVALIIIGVVGVALIPALAGGCGTRLGGVSVGSGGGTFSSPGERLFLTGADTNGSPVPRTGGAPARMMNGGGGCASCHGTDGRGRTVSSMMASFTAPDIRWSVLTSTESTESGGSASTPFDETSFVRAVRDGLDPEGQPLKAPMPRWRLTDQQMRGLIAHIKTL